MEIEFRYMRSFMRAVVCDGEDASGASGTGMVIKGKGNGSGTTVETKP
jgi:hypothetical protein